MRALGDPGIREKTAKALKLKLKNMILKWTDLTIKNQITQEFQILALKDPYTANSTGLLKRFLKVKRTNSRCTQDFNQLADC